MSGKHKPSGKTWTVLIYANGNNDMEPEIYRGIKAVREAPVPENVKVIIQLARAPKLLVQVFRGQAEYPPDEQWQGVRRYLITHTGMTQVADLGPVNMADPSTLADFLIWGYRNYPADCIMVIVSGHGAGFTGLLTDYTQPYPVIMSLKGLTAAFRHFRRETGKQCTILVIDACFMNMIEVWYELALTPTRPVRFLLTPLGDASMECLPYQMIIRELCTSLNRKISALQYVAGIVPAVNGADKISGDILAVNLAATNFVQLKDIIDQLAGCIIANNLDLATILGEEYRRSLQYPLLNVLQLNARLADACPLGRLPHFNLPAVLDSIIPVPPYATQSKLDTLEANIFLPITPGLYPCFSSDYEQLLFAANNRWLQVLRSIEDADYGVIPCSRSKQVTLPPPVSMPISSVMYSLQAQAPHLSGEEVQKILKDLGWHKSQ